MESYAELSTKLIGYLRTDDGWWKHLLANTAEKTGAKEEQLAMGVFSLVALYLIFGHFAELLCNIVGFAMPAYYSVLALMSEDKDDDTQWLTYWAVFGLFSLVDTFAGGVMAYFPFYWLLKMIFLVYLWHPVTRGAEALWKGRIDPICDMTGAFAV